MSQLSFRHHQDLLSRKPSHLQFFDNQLHQPSPAQYHSHQQQFNPNPQQSAYSNSLVSQSSTTGPYMSSNFDFSGPAIRVQHSTPTPQPSIGYQQNQGFPTPSNAWQYGGDDRQMNAVSALQASASNGSSRGHSRATSSSSVGSNSSASPFGHATSSMYAGHPSGLPKVDSSFNTGADESSRSASNHLPTPTQTPTQDTFLVSSAPSYSQFQNIDSTMAAHMAMKQAFAEGNSTMEDDAPGFSHSTRHSVSSFGRNSPATPRTINGEDFDEGFKLPSAGEDYFQKVENWSDTYLHFDELDMAVRPPNTVPKFERTLTDVFSDELYNPTSIPSSSTPQKKQFPTLLSPYHNVMMNERLQQANQARSQSPTAGGSRGVSPFRQGSPYAQTSNSFASPQRLSAGAQLRQKQKSDAEAAALSHQGLTSQQISEPKTISPKDAVLEYHESEQDSKMPLFPDTDNAQFNPYAGNFAQSMPSKSDNSYASLTSGGAANGWTNPSGTNSGTSYSAASTTPSQSQFNFTPSSVPGMFHGLPTGSYSSASMVPSSEETPEFPAHLTSMESSASEAPPQSSQNSNGTEPTRPISTLADSGTYTCTYHGCTQRLETPQKLQRHKREAHRQSHVQPTQGPPPTPGIGSGMTSAALAARNSQAGPHKCERINPTTGKPCNTIFSRPYDLTRHEDTIHNIRKQKVRCALCQEKKTFSRNDALTRHMRVVHPDVDFPGKHRKRGGRSDE